MRIFKKIQDQSRKKKFELFMRTFNPTEITSILDVGCGEGNFLELMYPFKKSITCIDISEKNIEKFKKLHPNIKIMQGNAKDMPFEDNSFDIVFSNAVIEHVGDINEQKKFAKEISRVGRNYFITTPNKFFPLEPHYRFPFFQFIPKKLQKILTNHFSIGNYPKGYWEDINLLSSNQLKELFPESKIVKHRITFYPETLIAISNSKKGMK